MSIFSGGPQQNSFFSTFLTLPHNLESLGIKIRNCLFFLTLLSENSHSEKGQNSIIGAKFQQITKSFEMHVKTKPKNDKNLKIFKIFEKLTSLENGQNSIIGANFGYYLF